VSRPIGQPVRAFTAPVEPSEIMATRRDNDLVHIRELRTVLLPIMAEYRSRLDAQQKVIADLTTKLAVEHGARVIGDSHLSQDHMAYVAGTWEARIRYWWDELKWEIKRPWRRLRDHAMKPTDRIEP